MRSVWRTGECRWYGARFLSILFSGYWERINECTEEVIQKRSKRRKGKRAEDLSGLPKEIINHDLSEDELRALYPDEEWKKLPDEVYHRYSFTPAKIALEEHHVVVYSGKKDGTYGKGKTSSDCMNTLTIFLQRFRNTWTIRTMISVKNFCPGQLNSLQNAGNNTEIKPLRRAANYSGVPTAESLRTTT